MRHIGNVFCLSLLLLSLLLAMPLINTAHGFPDEDQSEEIAPPPPSKEASAPAPIVLKPGQPIKIQVDVSGGKTIITLSVDKDGDTSVSPPTSSRLEDDLRQLYKQSNDPNKVKYVASLAVVYRWAAQGINDKRATNAGIFRQALTKRSTAELPANVMTPLRERVRDELRTVLPRKSDATLDDATKDKAAKLFNRLADIMEGMQ